MCRDNSALTIEGTPTINYYDHKKRRGKQGPQVPWCGELKISICIHLVKHKLNASNISDHFDELIHDEHVNLDHGPDFNDFFHPRFEKLVQRTCTKLQEKGACEKKTPFGPELVYDSLTLEWTEGNSGRSKCRAFLEENGVKLQFRNSRFSATVEDERDTELNYEEGDSGQDEGFKRDNNRTRRLSTTPSTNSIDRHVKACKDDPRSVIETLVRTGRLKALQKNPEFTPFIPLDKLDEWNEHLNSPANDATPVLQRPAGHEASKPAISTKGKGEHPAISSAENVPGAFPSTTESPQSGRSHSALPQSPPYPLLPSLAARPSHVRRPARLVTKRSQQSLGGDSESGSTDKSTTPTAASAYAQYNRELPAAARHGEPVSISRTPPDPSRMSREQLKARILVLTEDKIQLDREVVQLACEIDILWAYWQFRSSSS